MDMIHGGLGGVLAKARSRSAIDSALALHLS